MKVYKDDGDEDTVSRCQQAHLVLTVFRQDTPQPSGSITPLDRTSTGIISNRPQKFGLSVLEAPDTANSTGMGVMALAKRESARRGLYSRFFRGPVLGPDAEETQTLELDERPLRSRSGPNDPKSNVSITKQRKGKKRRSWEEDDKEIEVAQEKGKSNRKSETKEERKVKRLKKEAERSKVSEVRLDGEDEGALTTMSAAPESSAQNDCLADYHRKKDRRKKRKRKDRESSVRHDG